MTGGHYSELSETKGITLRLFKLCSNRYSKGKYHVILWPKHRHEG
jgi:hypothetical protein